MTSSFFQTLYILFKSNLGGIQGILTSFAINICFGLMISYVFGTIMGRDISSFLPYVLIGFSLWSTYARFFNSARNNFLTYINKSEQSLFQIFRLTQLFFLSEFLLIGFTSIINIAFLYVFVQINVEISAIFSFLVALYLSTLISLSIVSFLIRLLCSAFPILNDVVSFLIRAMIFVTPIIWDHRIESLRLDAFENILIFNPVFYLIDMPRSALLGYQGPTNILFFAIFALLSYILVVFLHVVLQSFINSNFKILVNLKIWLSH